MLVGHQAPNFQMITTKDLNTLEHVATREDYRGRWLRSPEANWPRCVNDDHAGWRW
jgi:hypothetical protein